jgi:membrane associated rhomboid family serine protease
MQHYSQLGMRKTSTKQSLRQVQDQINTWFADTKITRTVFAFLFIWYVIIWYVPLGFDESTTTYWFIATANPSPGWILAMLSHVSITHFLANAGQLLLFGSIVERRLNTQQYLTFLFTVGLITTLFQVIEYNIKGITGGMVGASGATFSIVTFALIALLEPLNGSPPTVTSPTDHRPGLILAALIILIGQLLNDFTPYLSFSQRASGIAHLSGMILGATVALLYTSR